MWEEEGVAQTVHQVVNGAVPECPVLYIHISSRSEGPVLQSFIEREGIISDTFFYPWDKS